MSNIDYNNLLQRIAALEVEALAEISVTADAVPRFIHSQESFPYFINRIGNVPIASDSQDFDTVTIPVEMRLIVGNLTAGYDGEMETRLYTYIPQVKRYFHERELLTSATYTTPMTDLTQARIGSITGTVVFQGSEGSQRIGALFNLNCDFIQYINQRY